MHRVKLVLDQMSITVIPVGMDGILNKALAKCVMHHARLVMQLDQLIVSNVNTLTPNPPIVNFAKTDSIKTQMTKLV